MSAALAVGDPAPVCVLPVEGGTLLPHGPALRLLLALEDPTADETHAVACGRLTLALVLDPPALVARFDGPEPVDVAAPLPPLPASGTPWLRRVASGRPLDLDVVLCDSTTRTVQALRHVDLAHDAARLLVRAAPRSAAPEALLPHGLAARPAGGPETLLEVVPERSDEPREHPRR